MANTNNTINYKRFISYLTGIIGGAAAMFFVEPQNIVTSSIVVICSIVCGLIIWFINKDDAAKKEAAVEIFLSLLGGISLFALTVYFKKFII